MREKTKPIETRFRDHKVGTIEAYLFEQYQKRGSLYFYFTSRKISRILKLSSHAVGHYLTTLKTEGVIFKFNQRIWVTNFRKKPQEKKKTILSVARSYWRRFKDV